MLHVGIAMARERRDSMKSNAAILGRTLHPEQNAGRDEFCAGIARRTVALRLV
jgi:hypothetical protein